MPDLHCKSKFVNFGVGTKCMSPSYFGAGKEPLRIVYSPMNGKASPVLFSSTAFLIRTRFDNKFWLGLHSLPTVIHVDRTGSRATQEGEYIREKRGQLPLRSSSAGVCAVVV